MEVTERKPTTVVNLPHPLRPDAKEICAAEFLPGETLGAYISRNGIQVARGPVNVWHNGSLVPQHLWTRLIPRNGDFIVIRAKMQGGGGGNKILRTVAMVALVVAGAAYGGVLGAALGFTGTTAAAIGSSIIMIGGSLLINALLPPPKPTYSQLGVGQKYASSPTYAISGGRNRMRQWEPMTLVFGKHRVVPDLAATPYTRYQGSTQYLYQAFHFGLQGLGVSISDIRIGKTPITNYEGIQIERSSQDGKLSSIAGNVDTIQGFTLSHSDGWQMRTTADKTTTISVELAAQLFKIDDSGKFLSRSVDVHVQYRKVGASTWTEVGTIGAVYATHYWSLQNSTGTQQYRYGSTNRADHTEGETEVVGEYWDNSGEYSQLVQIIGRWRWVPHPYSQGKPWAGIAPTPLISAAEPGVRMSGASQSVKRTTVTWNVPSGAYEIRVYKETADIKDSRESNETAVNQILAFQEDTADYTNQARLAVIIRASGQLNGAIDELNALVSASCPVWDGDEWVVKETSNPAWWFRWFALGRFDEDGNRLFGGGLALDQIDDDAIKAWAAWCDQKQLTLNWVLDRKMPSAEVLQTIARCGRASPTWQTGRLGVIWDQADLPISAMFGPFNIRAGSFSVAYTNEGSVDEVIVNFANRDRDYEMDEVRVRVPGATTTTNPLQLDFDGCVDRDMAGREANLLAASQVWHRRRVSWETDIEGLVCTRGDVVSISHDLTVWGYSGRLMPGSHGADSEVLPVMVLDGTVPSSGTGTVMLRAPDGTMKVVSVVSEVGEVHELTITTDLAGFPMPGDEGWEDANPLDWAWQFDPIATPGRRFKIISVQPSGDGVKFEAIDDDPGYYASETDPYQYTPPRDGALLSGLILTIAATEAIVNVSADQIRLSIGWVSTVDGPCLVVAAVNGEQRYTGAIEGRSLDLIVATGDVVDVTITPKRTAGASGTPKSAQFIVQGLLAPLPPVQGLTSVFRDGLTVLSWLRVVDMRLPGYEVRLGDTWANSRVIGRTSSLEALAVGNGRYWVAAYYQAPGGQVVYGEPDSILIAGATLVRNVILSRDEAPEWAGTLEDGAYIHHGMLTLAPQGDFLAIPDLLAETDILWDGGPAESGIYTVAEGDRVDIGFVAPVRIDAHIAFHARNLVADILGAEDIFALPDILNGSDSQHVAFRPQIRSAQEEGEWSEWRDLVPGLINARYFDFRLLLSTDDPTIVPFITELTWVVDVPDLIQHAEGVTVPEEGLIVAYGKRFHAIPNVQLTVLDEEDGDRAVLTDSDEEGFFVQILNGSAPVERNINWFSQGY